jgi:hypothetical protein
MRNQIFFLFFIYSALSKSQAFDWVALSQTVNKPVQTLAVYQNQLIAAGGFSLAGATPVKRIAAWDGSTWFSLGTGIKGGPLPTVYKLLSYNNELYACGRFDSAGSIATKNIAKWDGSNWSGFGTVTNDEIYSMAFYNGQLYAAGMFTVIGGIPAKNIAKWNGTQWQAVGSGVNYGTNASNLCVYQNALYVTGLFDTIGNVACQNIAKWNGTSWSAVSSGLPYGLAMHVWQNKLLLGTGSSSVSPYPTQIWQWNGSALSLFSQQTWAGGSTFLTYNNKLYSASGSPSSVGKSTIWEWNTVSSLWDSVGTNIQSVSSLCEYNNEIYCGGFFNSTNGAQANYIAKLADVTSLKKIEKDNLNINVYPNPVHDRIYLHKNDKEAYAFEILNTLGQVLFFSEECSDSQEINLSHLPCAIYYIKIYSSREQRLYKLFKD